MSAHRQARHDELREVLIAAGYQPTRGLVQALCDVAVALSQVPETEITPKGVAECMIDSVRTVQANLASQRLAREVAQWRGH